VGFHQDRANRYACHCAQFYKIAFFAIGECTQGTSVCLQENMQSFIQAKTAHDPEDNSVDNFVDKAKLTP
jgi:hypothetical protein